MIAHAILALPWQHVACVLFECVVADYVVLVDYYSDFFEIDRFSDKRSNEVVRKRKAHFARHGCPETLAFSDLFVAVYTSGLELRKMTDARSKFELRRLKVSELKHFLKGKRIPYTEKEQKSLCC